MRDVCTGAKCRACIAMCVCGSEMYCSGVFPADFEFSVTGISCFLSVRNSAVIVAITSTWQLLAAYVPSEGFIVVGLYKIYNSERRRKFQVCVCGE